MRIRLNQAFTMIEMMVVIFIIGIIMAIVVPQVAKYRRSAEETEIKLKVANIQAALASYRMEFGEFPSNRDGLRALVENPRPNDEQYRKAERANKWPFVVGGEKGIEDNAHNEFIYHCPPEKYRNKYHFYEILWIGSGTEDDPEKDFGE